MIAKHHLKLLTSKSHSGNILKESLIPFLKNEDFIIIKKTLIGDAPKEFLKAYFYEKNSSIRKTNKKTWDFYIAKTAEKWYPHESVIEYLINRIGQVLGLHINDVKIVKYNGQIRFLSRYFINENEKLVHGAEICGEYLADMELANSIAHHKNTARELFTFQFIRNAINAVYPTACVNLLNDLVKMLIFDALVGNNDRHFYNWGVIDNIKKTKTLPIFAPIFDSARGLLWNYSDLQLKEHWQEYIKNGKIIESYINRAYPRISIEENKKAKHFDLIKFLKEEKKEYKDFILEMSSEENELKVLKMFRREFSPLFIPERQELIKVLLQIRFKKIREM